MRRVVPRALGHHGRGVHVVPPPVGRAPVAVEPGELDVVVARLEPRAAEVADLLERLGRDLALVGRRLRPVRARVAVVEVAEAVALELEAEEVEAQALALQAVLRRRPIDGREAVERLEARGRENREAGLEHLLVVAEVGEVGVLAVVTEEPALARPPEDEAGEHPVAPGHRGGRERVVEEPQARQHVLLLALLLLRRAVDDAAHVRGHRSAAAALEVSATPGRATERSRKAAWAASVAATASSGAAAGGRTSAPRSSASSRAAAWRTDRRAASARPAAPSAA